MRLSSGFVAALLLQSTAFSASAETLNFTLINSTSYVISKLQISPVTARRWGENILGRDVLLQGETATVTIADGRKTCEYDMLITFNDGATIEELDYNFCDLESYEARN